MKEILFLHLDQRRASNLARHSLELAAKRVDGALSLGFPSFRSAAHAARDKNFDSLIHAFFCVSCLTDRAGRHARSGACWL